MSLFSLLLVGGFILGVYGLFFGRLTPMAFLGSILRVAVRGVLFTVATAFILGAIAGFSLGH